METKNDIYAQFGLLGFMFKAIDKYPAISNILLWLLGLLLAWTVFTYDFTIPAYQ